MSFKVHFFCQENLCVRESYSDSRKEEIFNKISLFEEEVANLYFEAQEGYKGIKTLGNQIRESKIIENDFFKSEIDYEIVKCTGNQNSFYDVFISKLEENFSKKDLYLFIYEELFRKQSSIVDSTTIKIKTLERKLISFFKAVKSNNLGFSIYILEFTGIENCYFTKNGPYTRINKLN